MDRELLKPFKLCFGILRANGLWQDGKQSKLYIFYGCFVVLFFLILFTIGLLTYEIKTDDFDEKVVSFATALVYTGVFIKVVNFLLKFERIIEAFESLDNLLKDCKDPNQANRDCIRMKTRIAYNVLIMFWLSSILSWAAGFLSFIFAHRTPYNLWYPFDIQTSNIGFLIASFYVLLVSLSVGSFVIALDMLPVIFMSLAVGLINELSERLKAVDNKTEFIKCVVVHIKLKDFTRTIQELFASVILSQLVFTAVIMCTAVFALSKANELSIFFQYSFCIIVIALEVFLPCYYGNEVSLASSKLSSSLYHCDWIKSDIQLKKLMRIFMENSKKNQRIVAYGVVHVNLETFFAILNAAYSLFAVLKTFEN